ncbi:bifunctional diaminohydroxyphosphoribosylaminopyrimidine deaminase/5-amino-6-(5-phosphoribosylamino)uracil reductase RibD [Cutibacterium sp.]|uniref:bifunctional diaminohydroxyphosphoribosylaminopyrimidine deaminase/5-amino-6-(5-phosphoribosylamino)uracil reductase RibD n=1 Tax=Cutibacterium sp. TaxID=1912221 RepID=UPI0026DD6485|nr:bifunctional diaminohydroxyphosphoribosylaminopyrimidine deaminase/5-amino-6-(5-phosphoribosylamino)uracil reductase RibD [Cutibacterium sp.]MDO4413194.1 bifunctional diaminohydroxyphosphoribosylaminopyrimidine deaminase/5-amino-6-(5-phosphoribosylamino)uracil reductase RibD [Cutibacterium sp.]
MDQRWDDVMRLALNLAENSPCPDPNPRVGCVIIADGQIVGQGWHHGAGTPHAEVEALRQAGDAARGATAVVTLEPCNHTGRTGPCSHALLEAGVCRVVIAQCDPNAVAAGGAQFLSANGVEVVTGVLHEDAMALNADWTFSQIHRRPRVCWKYAATLDGRSAAPDGTSQWITGEEARHQVQIGRSRCGAIIVGTGTAVADNPRLTVRLPEAIRQPLRVVVGMRDLPADCHLHDESAETLQIRHHDPAEVLDVLWHRGIHRVWLEGGPRVAGAFLAADLVDEVVAYIAPTILGNGRAAVIDPTVTTLASARHFVIDDVCQLGPDLQIRAHHQ